MKVAICINCGRNKHKPTVRCPACGFLPKTDEDRAKSLMLSMYYEIDGEYLGKSNEELLEIGRQLSAGTYRFDDKEVQRIVTTAKKALELPPFSQMAGGLLRWLGPPIVVIAIALYLWLRK